MFLFYGEGGRQFTTPPYPVYTRTRDFVHSPVLGFPVLRHSDVLTVTLTGLTLQFRWFSSRVSEVSFLYLVSFYDFVRGLHITVIRFSDCRET